MSRRWGLIGFGEAGRIIGGALAASGADLLVHDRVLLDPARGTAVREAVTAAGATPVDDLAEFADRDVVVSLVTPATAVLAARGFAPHAARRRPLRRPELHRARRQARRRAVLRGVAGGRRRHDRGRHHARRRSASPSPWPARMRAEAADLLNAAGLNAAVVGDEIGAAAALKMLRSVVVKGMEGLWVEALLAARERGVVEPLLAMIEETLDRYSTRDFATMLVTTHVAHAGRRQVEVRMSRDTVAGTGVPPLLSDGVARPLRADARGLAAAGQEPGVVPADPGRRAGRSSGPCQDSPA